VTERLRRWALPALTIASLIGAGVAFDLTGALPLYRAAIHRTPSLLPSTIVMAPEEVARGVSTVSLYVPFEELTGEGTGILRYRIRHGPSWERFGWVSFFENGKLIFSGGAGVRVHGGGSRKTENPQSFRLFFRRRYGLQQLPAGVAFGGEHDHPLKRLILHNDSRPWLTEDFRFHFVNPLGYDIARALGNITPATRPVRFYLNGHFDGVYVLTEHFDAKDWFNDHVGRHASMADDDLDQLWRDVLAVKPLRMREVAKLLDLDNMTRWYIAAIFSDNRDAYQGPGQFMDRGRTGPPWIWVTWDVDQSFREPEHDILPMLLEIPGQPRRGRRENEPRPYVFTTLLAEDPEYREYFKRLWVDAMNYVLTPSFLEERASFYEERARTLGVTDVAYQPVIRKFFAERPAALRAMIAPAVQSPPMVRVHVSARGHAITSDGHPIPDEWDGYFFRGQTVSLQVPVAAHSAFRAWRLNGRDVPGTTLDLRVDRDATVDAEWIE